MSRRILLVDDEPAILLTLKTILEIHCFQVVTAASSAEAKLRLEEDSFRLVITDMNMEERTSGLEVLRFAKQQPYCPAVAILTANPDLCTDWKQQGAEALWTKPANMRELLEQIGILTAEQPITTDRKKITSTDATAARNSTGKIGLASAHQSGISS